MPLARPSKEAFFAPFAKNAPRAAFASIVSVFWKRCSQFAHGLANNHTSQDGCGINRCFLWMGVFDIHSDWSRVPAADCSGHALIASGCRFAKAQNGIPMQQTKAARDAFFAKIAKNASFEERAKGKGKIKGKTLGEESPRPALFFHQ
ncbi:MAG: hypothetical protein H7834_01580 [Magnetococcus sp. YQC-9]